MKRKKLFSCLSVVLVLVMVATASAFETPCEHEWTEEIVTPATCTEDGTKRLTCIKCNYKIEKPIDATGHEWTEKVITPATCTADGTKLLTCTKCNYNIEKPIDATGHEWTEKVITPATCTKDGTKLQTCTKCNYNIERLIPALGHTEEAIPGKAATCNATGLTEGTKCSVCGEILTAQQTIPATGLHTPGEAVKENENPATATAAGSYDEVVYCTVCGEEISRETKTIPATGTVPSTDEPDETDTPAPPTPTPASPDTSTPPTDTPDDPADTTINPTDDPDATDVPEAPVEPDGPTGGPKGGKDRVPKTGDGTNIALWAALFALCAGGAVILAKKPRKN